MKRWIAAVLAAMMILGNFGEVYAAPEETTEPETVVADEKSVAEEPELHTGLAPMQEVEIRADEISPKDVYHADLALDQRIYASKRYSSDWDIYSTNYYYNQLSDGQKAAWDGMDAVCRALLEGTATIDPYSYEGDSYYLTQYVWVDGVWSEDMLEAMRLFRLSNPQYYFLNSGGFKSYDMYGSGYAFMVYDAFAVGEARKAATETVRSQIKAWEGDLKTCKTQAETVKMIHDQICAKVTYDDDAFEAMGDDSFDDNDYYSQTAYSVFAREQTVCAGYAQAFCLMCNGQNIDTISVTSPGHQWNKTRLDDSWYNVDLTWDDENWGRDIAYIYYLRSDNSKDFVHIYHTEEVYLRAYLPPCTLDSNATYDAPGTLPVISGVTATPGITITSGGGFYSVYFSCSTPNATIYYTQNGETPSVAATKSTRYRMPLWITDLNAFKEKVRAKQVQAVAVSNARWDSAVSSPDTLYTVSYVMNGGTNHEDNPVAYSGLATAFALKNPTRSGYAFGGWYTDSSFTRRITAISAGSKENLTLYAKWTLLPSPTMKFASPSLTKTYEQNATFTNKLTANTDGKITYKSGNTKVATVDKNSGKVTIKGVGTTNITATAAVTSKFQGKSLSYTLTVKKNSKPTMKFASATVTKYPSGKTQTFTNKLTENTDGKITYKSGNTAIATVNSSGKVTIKKNAMGKVKITATAPATANCSKRTVSYTLQVIPKATTLSKVTNPSGKKLKATWKKIGSITGYQVQYSTDKNFKKGVTTKTVSDGKTTSETYGKLKKNKTYYVRVRTYKQKDKTKHYSQWSNVKSIKIKK